MSMKIIKSTPTSIGFFWLSLTLSRLCGHDCNIIKFLEVWDFGLVPVNLYGFAQRKWRKNCAVDVVRLRG